MPGADLSKAPLDIAYRQIAEALDGLGIALCLLDAEDRTLSWNRSFLRIFPEHDGKVSRGEPYRENLRRFYMKRLLSEEMPEIERYIADGIQRHRTQTRPFAFFHEGQWLRVSSVPMPGDARLRLWARIPGPGPGLTTQPTTGEAEATRRSPLEDLPDGVLVMDAAGSIISVNESFLSLYGFASRAAVLGRTYAALLHDAWQAVYPSAEALQAVERTVARLPEDRRFTGASFEISLPGERWVRVTEQQAADGVVHSMHVDITAMKRQQAIMEEARAAADRANRAKTNFLAMMSHEVRTPMHGIIGMTELLLETQLEAPQRQYAEAVRHSALGLLNILSDILDVTKLEAGRLTLESLEFRPAALVAEVGRLLETGSRHSGLRFQVETDPALDGLFLGDPSRIRQVLLNLGSNAVKFTPEGGVTIRATLGAGPRLRMEVVDTGVGFDEHKLGQLFEPFEQADSGTARRFGGSGLGLCISKRLVTLMGGTIGASRMPDGGSLFWFEVPLRRGGRPAPPPSSGMGPEDRRAASILLVEDNPTNQAVAKAMLTAAGHRVTVAADGSSAVALALASRPDLVLMDIQLPDMDGFAVTAVLRKVLGPAGAAIPIIAVTANAMAGYRDVCLAQGLNDYLPKPFSKKNLLAKIADWLPADPSRTA